LIDHCNHAFAFLSKPFVEQVAEVSRAIAVLDASSGSRLDRAETPTASMGEAEGAGHVEMAAHCAEHSTAMDANAIFKHRV
jgi:hypothetical protein